MTSSYAANKLRLGITMIELTLTDTWGTPEGHTLNYSWAKRHVIENSEDMTNRQILKIAREKFGITAKMRQMWDSGSDMAYKLDHACIALHVMFNY